MSWSWREFFGTHLGPGALCGVKLGDWLRLLAENRFAVDPPYWMRAALITGASVQNSLFAAWEHWRYARFASMKRSIRPISRSAA